MGRKSHHTHTQILDGRKMTYKALNTNKTIEINYKRTGYIQERKEKIIITKSTLEIAKLSIEY